MHNESQIKSTLCNSTKVSWVLVNLPICFVSFFKVLTGRVGKERIEIFSDAAMGIISTLLILDLTTEDFPDKKNVNEIGLTNTLIGMRQEFVAYIGTFVTVGMLWFVHHSVIQVCNNIIPTGISREISIVRSNSPKGAQ